MKPETEDNITGLLHKAGQSVPYNEHTEAFAAILKAIERQGHEPAVSFRQLSRTGILLLLIIISNIVLLYSFSGQDHQTGPQPAAPAPYLQPDLNLYP
jgi:hypothetical protein